MPPTLLFIFSILWIALIASICMIFNPNKSSVNDPSSKNSTNNQSRNFTNQLPYCPLPPPFHNHSIMPSYCNVSLYGLPPESFYENPLSYKIRTYFQFICCFVSIFGNLFVLWSIAPFSIDHILKKLRIRKQKNCNLNQTGLEIDNNLSRKPVRPTKSSKKSICSNVGHNHISKTSDYTQSYKHTKQRSKRGQFLLRSKVHQIMTHMAIADIIFSITTFGDSIWLLTIKWVASNVACKFYMFLKLFAMYSSSLMVTVISLDRCLSIVCPMQMVQNQKITLMMLYSRVVSKFETD